MMRISRDFCVGGWIKSYTTKSACYMSDTSEKAQRLFKSQPRAPAASEYERDQQRIRANLERLKAERLAREAGAKVS